MRQWLILVATVVLGLGRAQAQVEIYIDEADKSDTVIVFGVTSFNRPLTRSFTVRNATDSTIRIIPSRTDNDGQQSPVVNEFEGLFTNEDVPPQSTRSLNVRYRADVAFFPADSVAEVRLVLDVVRPPSLRPLQQKVLILRGLKTGNVLGTVQKHLRFDSVYVGTVVPRRATYTVQNLLPVRFAATSQRLLLRTPALGPKEILVDTFPAVEFPERGTIDWRLSYSPRDRGRDSADFEIRYANVDNVRDTIVVTKISGYGVEQQIDIAGAASLGSGPPVVLILPDTVRVDELAVGSTLDVAVRLSNTGNADVHVDSIRVTPEVGQGTCTVINPVRALSIGRTDTMLIRLRPSQWGEFVARIDLVTDLARRGFGDVPDAAVRRSIYVVVRTRSVLRVAAEPLSLGPVIVASNCSDQSTTDFDVVNTGISELRIDSISISPPGFGISVTPQSFVLPPGAARSLQCVFSPLVVGRFGGELTVHLSGDEATRPITFFATALAADTLALSAPDTVRGRPGSVVELPVTVASGTALGMQRARFVIDFNSTVASIAEVVQQATASENALLSIEPRTRGAVVTLRDDAGFPDRDTLIILRLRLYLGDSASTRVLIDADTSSIGLASCPDLLPLRIRAGRVGIDSVCGLSYKTAVGGLRTFRAGVLPNPAMDVATVAIMGPIGSTATVDVLDALGRPCCQTRVMTCTAAITTALIDVSMLPPAAYAVVVRINDGVQTIPLVVQR